MARWRVALRAPCSEFRGPLARRAAVPACPAGPAAPAAGELHPGVLVRPRWRNRCEMARWRSPLRAPSSDLVPGPLARRAGRWLDRALSGGSPGPTPRLRPEGGRPQARLQRPPAGALGLHSAPRQAGRWLACSAPRLEPRLHLRPRAGRRGGPAAGSHITLPGWSPGPHLRPEGGPAAGSTAAPSGGSPGLHLRQRSVTASRGPTLPLDPPPPHNLLAQGGPAAGSTAAPSGGSPGLHLRQRAGRPLARMQRSPAGAQGSTSAPRAGRRGGPAAGSHITLPGWSPGPHLRPEGGPAAGSTAAPSGGSPGLHLRQRAGRWLACSAPRLEPRLRLRPEVRHGFARPRAAARPAAAA
eukprot:tig00000344_g24300.t1